MKENSSFNKKTLNDSGSLKNNIVVKCSGELQYLVSVVSAIDEKFKEEAQQSAAGDGKQRGGFPQGQCPA